MASYPEEDEFVIDINSNVCYWFGTKHRHWCLLLVWDKTALIVSQNGQSAAGNISLWLV